MANAYIKEYDRTITGSNAESLGMVHSVPTAEQATLSTSATPASSSAFQYSWITIRVDADSYAAFGETPTADATDNYLEANKTYMFHANIGHKVSVRTVA